jgi:hypothetical protein
MTGGTIAGLVISSLILNGDHKWADIYSPSRIAPPTKITLSQLASSIKTTTEVSSCFVAKFTDRKSEKRCGYRCCRSRANGLRQFSDVLDLPRLWTFESSLLTFTVMIVMD